MTDSTGQQVMDFSKATRPLSHTNDPETSYEAADKMIESGKLNDQEFGVYSAILKYGVYRNFTAKELSEKSGLNYWTIQRRLSGLRQKNKIRRVQYREHTSPVTFVLRCTKRKGCCVWRTV